MNGQGQYTNQREVRSAFWSFIAEWRAQGRYQGVSVRRMVKMGDERTHNTDTRCAFSDWLNDAEQDGRLAEGLVERATL